MSIGLSSGASVMSTNQSVCGAPSSPVAQAFFQPVITQVTSGMMQQYSQVTDSLVSSFSSHALVYFIWIQQRALVYLYLYPLCFEWCIQC